MWAPNLSVPTCAHLHFGWVFTRTGGPPPSPISRPRQASYGCPARTQMDAQHTEPTWAHILRPHGAKLYIHLGPLPAPTSVHLDVQISPPSATTSAHDGRPISVHYPHPSPSTMVAQLGPLSTAIHFHDGQPFPSNVEGQIRGLAVQHLSHVDVHAPRLALHRFAFRWSAKKSRPSHGGRPEPPTKQGRFGCPSPPKRTLSGRPRLLPPLASMS